MIGWALGAALVSGLAWSGLDVARKSLARDQNPAAVATGLSLGVAVLFGGWTALAVPPVELAAYLGPAVLSILLCVGVQLAFLESVRRSELSRTIPLLSLTPVATSVFGAAVLGEQLSTLQWAGILLVFVGAASLGVSRGESQAGSTGGPLRLRLDPGGRLMLAAALGISAAAPFDKLAVAASSPAAHGFVQSLVAGLLLLGWMALRGELVRISGALRARPAMLVAVLLAFVALGLQFVAYRGAMVGVVETIKRVVGLVSSLAAGRLVFGEPITPRKITTVILMALGVTLILY